MQIGSLFSGIGGFDLAASWIGWETKWYSEIDPYAIRVMGRRFPGAYNVGDVTEYEPTENHTVDVLCGGFPCQPVSCAGKRLGQADPRWLWPHFARIIRVLRPRYVVVENVPGLLGRGARDVLRDFAEVGYDVEWETIPAVAVGAPHKRDRVWIIAHSLRERLQIPARRQFGSVREQKAAFTGSGLGRAAPERWTHWATEPDVGRMVHGVPSRVDRLRCLGNSIVPQIAYWIFQQIEAYDRR